MRITRRLFLTSLASAGTGAALGYGGGLMATAGRDTATALTLLDRGTGVRNVLDFGARGDGATDDLARLYNALEATPEGGVLWIPDAYTFGVSDVFRIDKRVHVTGGGVLKLLPQAREATAVLWLSADEAAASHLAVDGNQANVPGNAGRGEGVRMSGRGNRLLHCVVRDTKVAGTGNAVYVAPEAEDAFVFDVRALRGGYAGFRNDGNGSVFRQIESRDWAVKGFVHNGSADSLWVDGFRARTSVVYSGRSGTEALLLDPGGSDVLRYASVRGLDIYADVVGNVAKFACIERLEISDSVVTHTAADGVATVRFAENMGRATFRGSVLGAYVVFGAPMDEAVFEDCLIGDANGGTVMRCLYPRGLKRLRVHRCEFRRFTEGAVREENPDSGIVRREYVDCAFVGDSGDTCYVETRARGAGATRSGKIAFLNGSISNRGAGNALTSPSGAFRDLFTTRDLTGHTFAMAAVPTGSLVTYQRGDRIYFDDPEAAQAVGAVCTATGAPGTWEAFGDEPLTASP